MSVGHSAEPLTEASLVADLTWLTTPARAGRGSRSREAQETARWLSDELALAGYKVVTLPISASPSADPFPQVNVIAELGSPDIDAVIVMAHYDHLGVIAGETYPGADDNASGVVVALAVARELKRAAPVGHVIFLFTAAEEIGLGGAKAYAARPVMPLDRIRVVYNLDMVGRNFLASSGNEEAKIAAVGLPENSQFFDLAIDTATAVGLRLLPIRAAALTIVHEDHRSDDWVFRDLHIPAVHFSTGINDDYHRPTDTADKVSRPQLVRMAAFMRALVDATRR